MPLLDDAEIEISASAAGDRGLVTVVVRSNGVHTISNFASDTVRNWISGRVLGLPLDSLLAPSPATKVGDTRTDMTALMGGTSVNGRYGMGVMRTQEGKETRFSLSSRGALGGDALAYMTPKTARQLRDELLRAAAIGDSLCHIGAL